MLGFIAILVSATSLLVSLKLLHDIRGFVERERIDDIKRQLKNHHLRQNELRDLMQTINNNQSGIHSKVKTGLRRSSLIRFNPYRDTGGDQSFCLALLNDENNGYILTAVHGREGTRTYAKEIKLGKSEYKLSSEEQQALNVALRIN